MKFVRNGYLLFAVFLMCFYVVIFYLNNYVAPDKCRLAGFTPSYGLCWRD